MDTPDVGCWPMALGEARRMLAIAEAEFVAAKRKRDRLKVTIKNIQELIAVGAPWPTQQSSNTD